MTTLADVRRIFSIRGIDPDRITQPSGPGEAEFEYTTPSGGHVWFAADERDRHRTGWAYCAWNQHGEVTESGHTDSTALESVLPVLSRHRTLATAPASRRQLDTLLALANPDEHAPLALRTDSPADRWILGLFVAWTRLQDAGDGSINGGDLLTHLGQAFAAIGLPDEPAPDELGPGLDELAARVDPGPRDPAAAVIAPHLAAALDQALERALARTLDQQLGVLTVTDLAAGMAAGLRQAGLLATDAGAAHGDGQVGA